MDVLDMRLILLLAALAIPATATPPVQDSGVSSSGVTAASAELPVSLDRIRNRLAAPAPLQQSLAKRPTFTVEVEVELQQYLREVLSSIDLKNSPPPPGGLYGYEVQRVMARAVNQPLMQPYAAFGGGELLTLAIEGLITKYVVGRALDAITASGRARAEAAARAEVTRSIAEYCAGLPEGGAGLRLCATPP